MMRRSPTRTKPYRRLGQAARERVKNGGPLATGRKALSRDAYRDMVEDIEHRMRGGCEIVFCARRGKRDTAHVIPRSAGGEDSPENILRVCRNCHKKMDERRMILVESIGNETFRQTDVATNRTYVYHRHTEGTHASP